MSPCKIISVSEDTKELTVQLLLEEVKGKKAEKVFARLPFGHTSDHPEHTSLALVKARFSVGDSLSHVVVYKVSEHIFVSCKPLLLLQVRLLGIPKAVSGSPIIGFVGYRSRAGVSVRYFSQTTEQKVELKESFVVRQFLSSAPVAEDEAMSDLFHPYQTLFGKVTGIASSEKDAHKVLISLKTNQLADNVALRDQYSKSLLSSYLNESRMLAKEQKGKDILVGSRCQGQVYQVKEFGVVCKLDGSEVLGVCLKKHCTLPSTIDALKVADQVTCFILHVNYAKGVADVSIEEPATKKAKTDATTDVQEGSIALVHSKYCIVRLQDSKERLGIAWLLFDPKVPPSKIAKVGAKCTFRLLKSMKKQKNEQLLPEEYNEVAVIALVSVAGRMLEGSSVGKKGLFGSPASRVEVEKGVIVRFKVHSVNKKAGFVSVIPVNVHRRKGFKKHTLFGIHCTDIVMPDTVDRVDWPVLGDLVEGDVREGRIVEINTDLPGKIKNKVFLSLNTEAEQSVEKLSASMPSYGIVNKVTDDGLVVWFDRRRQGIIFCTDLSSDIEVLENIFSAKTDEERLKLLGLKKHQPVKVKRKKTDSSSGSSPRKGRGRVLLELCR